ncbi:outer membrane beta-barrel protein [Aureibaculum sp. 2210JD6-5]|uniref:outer membrane beta-barrel protein n=1 Tax=Aureibaculum sp. 2210JD6-5 TaxID=3103957 RepID=UPI002AADA97A|nr:outer membrane beta-barrel protein [Aureibaculum sp. 2210JD6-5]MDY7395091.1 outer membrane beta-barrel protein [Aureibaculum sp. 2210JD6-5]
MKKLVLTLLTLTLTTTFLSAQIDIGLKGGVNYNFGGDLSEVISEVGNNAENLIAGADNKAGFHLGLWTRFHFAGLYLRPEISYTELNNSYNNNDENVDTDFKTKKIDIPILLGTKLIGPVHIYGGPSIQYITKSDFSQSEFDNISTNDFSVGLQIGTGLELGRLGIDVRWEKGFSNDLDGKLGDTNINVDNRPNQIIFGLAYRFNDRRR